MKFYQQVCISYNVRCYNSVCYGIIICVCPMYFVLWGFFTDWLLLTHCVACSSGLLLISLSLSIYMTPVITGTLSYEQGETSNLKKCNAVSSVLSGKLLICGVYRYTAHPAKRLVTSSRWLVFIYMFNLLCCYSNSTLK